MAWAVFTERFVFDRGVRAKIAFDIKPSPEPKNLPRDVVAAAVLAGKATRTKAPPRQSQTTAA